MQADTNTQMTDNTVTTTSSNLSTIISDALKQQAAQFKAIIGALQTQIAQIDVNKKNQSSKNSNASKSKSKKKPATPSTAPPKAFSTPMPPARPFASTSAKSTPKSPKTPQTPTPACKRHPLQVCKKDIPTDFKTTKVCIEDSKLE